NGAERLWELLHGQSYLPALGAMTGNQAIQQVKAGLQAIYVSGWQLAADANDAGQMYPDQSLYPVDSVPNVVRRINQALTRGSNSPCSRKERNLLVCSPDRRCRSWLRREPERVRIDESHDRGRRGLCSLRRPAFLGEEVRSSRRKGARVHGRSHSEARRCAAGRRCYGRVDAYYGAYRREQ